MAHGLLSFAQPISLAQICNFPTPLVIYEFQTRLEHVDPALFFRALLNHKSSILSVSATSLAHRECFEIQYPL